MRLLPRRGGLRNRAFRDRLIGPNPKLSFIDDATKTTMTRHFRLFVSSRVPYHQFGVSSTNTARNSLG